MLAATQYIFTKGMSMHPFSDQSGVVFFNTKSTVIGAVHLPLKRLEACMLSPSADHISENEHNALKQLLEMGFITSQIGAGD